MKIKTITCHDVYNVGASLQAYALQHYLEQCGQEVEIIDYKPEYLSRHYRFLAVNTPGFNKPFIRELYILAHFPQRLRAYREGKKQRFDRFKAEYLKVTEKRFHSCDELRKYLPEADCYIAGSDQIWNPYLNNGSDPSFYLQFAPCEKRRISYAASFATNRLPEDKKRMVRSWIETLDAISVREQSGVRILSDMGLTGIAVCDPVFLLRQEEWKKIAARRLNTKPYILLYDFDGNELIQEITINLAKRKGTEILSVFPVNNKLIRRVRAVGPREFLSLILYADAIVSNSFHAAAFSLIFHKDMYSFMRTENLNARITDLLADAGLLDRQVQSWNDCKAAGAIDWDTVDQALKRKIQESKDFLSAAIEGEL